MRKAKKRQVKYADKNAKDVEFQVGDSVYLKRHQRVNKLQGKCIPYYSPREEKSSNIQIHKQLDGSTMKTHAEQIRLANLEWEIPKGNKNMRKARCGIPIESSTDTDSEPEVDKDPVQKRIAKKYVKE